MDTHRPILTVERCLYLILFGAALALRLYRLNAPPLTEAEAREALIAFKLIQGQAAAGLPLASSPAYLAAAYLSFLLFGASEAIARLGPVLFGAGLVLVPALFREELGRWQALAAGALLAVSSSLLAAARGADGLILAVCSLALGIAALRRGLAGADVSRPWLAVCAATLGVGLAAGGDFLTGAVILLLAALVATWVKPDEAAMLRDVWKRLRPHAAFFFLVLGLAAVLVATAGSLYRSGLGALAASWGSWLAALIPSAAGRSPLTLLLFLAMYEPALVVFGLIGAVRAFKRADVFGQWLVWYALVALTFLLLYGGRTPADVVWIAAPLALLAGRALVDVVAGAWRADEWQYTAVQTGVILLLLVFAGLNLASLAEQARLNPDLSQGTFIFSGLSIPASRLAYVYLSGLAIVLVFVVSYLFAMGWSPRAARLGLTVSGFGVLLAAGFSAAWGLTQLRPSSPVELWWERPTAGDVRLLVDSLGDISNYSVGTARDIELTVQASPDGALAWALREFPKARFVEALDPSVNSPVVVAPDASTNPTLGSAYVGQSFAVKLTRAPGQGGWAGQVGWLVFRRAPVQAERVILWVRQDVQQLRPAGNTR